MKQWYSSSELAGLPGLPLHRGNVTRKAVAEGWQFRQRNSQGGGREYAYDSLPAPTQTRLYELECTLDGTLALTSDGANETTKWNELPLPIQLDSTTTSTTKVEQIDNRHPKIFNQVPKIKAKGGLVEQRTDAWLEILKAYESWSKLQKYSSALIRDLEFAKAYNTRQLGSAK